VLVNCGSPAQSKQLILRLESAGISQIDTLVLTSVRTDAAGGCADVLNYLSVGQVIWSGQRSSNAVLAAFQKSLQSNLPSVLTPTASPLRRDWGDGIRATVLVPSATADPDGSLGVLVEYAGTRTLLSGSQDVDAPSVDVLHVSGGTTVNGRALSTAANGTIVVSISPDGTPPVVQTER
jgi:beta-lactamase superfamily II metal-dependent hydrolase